MIGVIQYTIPKNFAEYINQTDLEKLDDLVSVLKKNYQKSNGWNALYHKPAAWGDILIQQRYGTNYQNSFQVSSQNVHRPRGRQAGPRPNHRPPPHRLKNFQGPPPHHGPPLPFDPLHTFNRVCLFDKNKKHIAGRMLQDTTYTYRPIKLSDQIIGFLGLAMPDKVEHPLDLNFLKKQANIFYLLGAIILLVTAMISFLLAKNILSPVHDLMKGTKKIKSFDFNTQINVTSNDELGLLAKDFNHMTQTLAKYEELRKNWISDISHELRTPISILKGKIEALQDGIRQMSPQMVDSLHQDVTRLEKLVQDLHLLSLADSQNLSLNQTAFCPGRLLEQVLNTFQTRLKQKQITLETEFDLYDDANILGNKNLISQVFYNLIENCLRYTDPPGKLAISRRIERGKFTLCFEDSSPGVPSHSLDRIFDRLYRVDKSRSRALGGSGLGLSICKQIITNHKGTIQAAHSHLGGLMIQITLPLQPKSSI
ncbi:MAG: HAMP domain-containing protein [Desulfobacteraceae bacterium]|nr:HAMP domain-containing protein [Desulfobacteraceae bacterium]